MSDAAHVPSRFVGGLAVVAGIGLTLGAGAIEAPLGVVPALLAQPLLALGVSWWRGSRGETGVVSGLRAVAVMALSWAVALALMAVVAGWPLAALRRDGGFGEALMLAAATALAVVAAWRTWPNWQSMERGGGPAGPRWRHAVVPGELEAWRGLGVALPLVALLGALLVLGWPHWLQGTARWAGSIGLAVLAPLLHGALQLVRPAESVEDDHQDDALDLLAEAVPEPASADWAFEGDLDAQLYEAARGGRVDRALQLIQAGADPHALPEGDARDRRSLAALAAVLPDLRLLRELIARGVDLNDVASGMTPLLAATRDSWHGRPEAVMTLLANGADPRVTDADGNTPLHHAARSSDPGVVALLRDAAADPEALNHDGFSPLGVACAAGNWRLARFMLERGAKAEPTGGVPALLAAAAPDEDDAAGVQLLLKSRARVDARDGQRRSALHEAVKAGHRDIVAALLEAGANLEARDADGRTPWLEAALHGRIGVLEQLHARGPDIGAVDGEGRNALLLACQSDHVALPLVRRLLEFGVDPAQTDHAGRHAVDMAAVAGRWRIVAELDPDYPLPSAVAEAVALPEPDAPAEASDSAGGAATGVSQPPDRAPIELLREGLQGPRREGLEALARLCAARELGGLLHDPALARRGDAVAWLLAHGAAAETPDAGGDVPLFAALARGGEAVAAIQTFLRAGVSPAGAGGLARFLVACQRHDQGARGLEQLALDLLERGADMFAASAEGDPCLALSVRLGWTRLQRRLLECGANVETRDSRGMTALHLAAALGREAALKCLLLHGASPDVRAADGQTPLGVALSSGRRDLADWLDWRIWTLPRRALADADLPAAAMSGDADAVRRLLDLGLPLDAVDAQGCTALLRAAGGGHAAVIDLLLARGADLNLAAHSGATPLSAAVSMRQLDIVGTLLAAGAPIEQKLPGGATVLMLASALGMPDIAARLLAAGADVHAGDAQGLTPLHCAALYGFGAQDPTRLLALFDALLLAGAESDLAAGQVTPLLLLLGARAQPGSRCDEAVVLAGVDRLLEEGVSLDAVDPRGFGVLHLAALHGQLALVRRLLRAGADPARRDTLNRTPRDIAVMRGFVDVAAELAPLAAPDVSPSMARFLRDPRG